MECGGDGKARESSNRAQGSEGSDDSREAAWPDVGLGRSPVARSLVSLDGTARRGLARWDVLSFLLLSTGLMGGSRAGQDPLKRAVEV